MHMFDEPTLLSPMETFVNTVRVLSTLSAPRLVHIQTFVCGQALLIQMVTNNTCPFFQTAIAVSNVSVVLHRTFD